MEDKKIWMRLGVTVPLTEDELFAIMEEAHSSYVERMGQTDGMDDYYLTVAEAANFLKRAIAYGESYIPEVCFDEHIDWWE